MKAALMYVVPRVVLTLLTIFLALWLAQGCVRNVQVCATYDRALQRPTFERPERDRVGASVCADVEPRP